MKCEKAQEWLSREMDGELAASDKALLDQHVAGCAACRAALAAWQQTGDFLRAETMEIPSAEVMASDVLRAIRLGGAEPVPAWQAGRLAWAGIFVGLLLLGAGIWGMLGARNQAVGLLASAEAASPVVESAEAELPGSSVMVYEDAESDTVVIWLMVADNGGDAPKGT